MPLVSRADRTVAVTSDRLTTMALTTLTLPRSSRTDASRSIAAIAAATWAEPAPGAVNRTFPLSCMIRPTTSPRWAMAAETMAGDWHATMYSGSCPMCAIPETRSPSSEDAWRRIQVPGSKVKLDRT